MKIKLIENGPIVLDTDAEFSVEIDGATQSLSGPLFLCRCGQSSNKPFCDSAHRKAGFEGASAELSVE